MSRDALLSEIDETALKLIRFASGQLSKEESINLPERVKAFGAVVDWFKIRYGLVPSSEEAKPKESKFDKLKREFGDSAPSHGRRSRRKAEGDDEAGAGSDAD